VSELRRKRKYTGSSHFVRAALDFANREDCYKSFGPTFDKLPDDRRLGALKNAAKKMFADGYVREAYMHMNNERSVTSALRHDFNITFARLPSGHAPHVRVVIESEKALRERVDFYMAESRATLGKGIRRPKPKKGDSITQKTL
jgi:hypothetical protein